jgi:hypothetical protein
MAYVSGARSAIHWSSHPEKWIVTLIDGKEARVSRKGR